MNSFRKQWHKGPQGNRHNPFFSHKLQVEVLEVREVPAGTAPAEWGILSQLPVAARPADLAYIQPSQYQTLNLDYTALQSLLQSAPMEFTGATPLQISLPTPDGTFARFDVVESPIMEPGLAAKFPEIKTYSGVGVDDPTAYLRFDISPYGFHAQVLSPTTGTFYIDPYYHTEQTPLISYYQKDLSAAGSASYLGRDPSFTSADSVSPSSSPDSLPSSTPPAARSSGTQLRTYRLAVAATGEYTAFQGGTVAAGQAAIVTAINRVTGIYEEELTIRLVLVANNNLLVYTNSATDPYTNNDPMSLLDENQTNIDAVIGSNNYDIGHVFSTAGGGLAGLGVVGVDGFKAQGETGTSSPVGDDFYVDYVAHEMGHQFGGDHTFNGVNGSAAGNVNPSTAFEPGSGSTIMGYAGICWSDDLQAHSDPYFHAGSFDEIITYVSSGPGFTSAQITATGNTIPTVNAGTDYTIPASTYFTLTATGSDANGDSLTYCWEEMDTGPQQALGSADNGSSPIFRSFSPTASPSRTFLRLTDILNGTSTLGMQLPTTTRDMDFRVTVRDNRSGGGGVNSDDMVVHVVNTGSAFRITSPNTAVTYPGLSSQTVTWNVAGTTGSGINAANVNILLSTDGGLTFPTVLASNTPNDGSQAITLPNVNTSTARIRVEGAGNIFFDINDANFTISAVTSGATITQSGGSTNVTEGGVTDSYTVVLNSAPSANVTITLNPGTQVTVSSTTLIFTPTNWSTAQTVTVTAVNDLIAEGPHTGTITHTSASSDANYNGIAIASVTANIADNDTAGMTITQSGGSTSVVEGGATDTYTVVLNTQPTANVVITLVPTSPNNQLTATPATLTFTPTNWNTAQTVTVAATNDGTTQGTHTGTIAGNATSSDTGYNGISIATVNVTITETATAGVIITQSGGSTNVTEGGATDSYTVVLSTAPTANVTITLNPGTQVTVSPTSLIFTPTNWSTAQTVTFTAVNDLVAQGTHTGTITHTATSSDTKYSGITVSSVTVSITDNDTAGVTITQSGGSTNVTEGGATDSYTAVLTSQPTSNVTITLNPGTQVTVAPTSLIFTPTNWNTAQTVTVTAVNDLIAQGPHTGTITHTASSGDSVYNGITIASVPVNITDNDTAGTILTQSGGSTSVAEGGTTDYYTVVLTSQPTANVTITFLCASPNNQLTATPAVLTFTAGNWNVAQTVTVAAANDGVTEGTHTGTIGGSVTSSDTKYNGVPVTTVNVTITETGSGGVTITQSGGSTNVTEGGATDSYTAVLTSAPTANVTITINPGTQVTVSPTTLIFTPTNWSTAQTVTVTAVNNLIAEGPHTGTINHTAASSDTKYNGIAVAGVTANITDNDTAGVTITQSGGSTSVVEGGATDSYTVVLTSQPTANVVITLVATSPNNQLTATPITLTFTPSNWNTAQTVTVGATNDGTTQGTHTGTIAASAASSDTKYTGISIATVNVTITEAAVAGVTITPSGGSTNVTEGGATDSYTVVLTAAPTANVTIVLNPGTQMTVSPTSLVFTPSNWSTAQTVTVTAIDDAVVEGPHTGTITHSATSSSASYNGIAIASVTANITDNDAPQAPGVTVTQSGGSTMVVKGGTGDSYTVVLNTAPSANVTVTLTPDSQLTVSPTSLVFTAANWNIPQTVNVTGVDTGSFTGPTTANVVQAVTSSDSNYVGLTIQDVQVTILDKQGFVVTGTSGNDIILVNTTSDPTKFAVSVNGKITLVPTTVTQLVIESGDGADTIQINNPLVPVFIDSGSGTDSLTINGSSSAANSYVLDGYSLTANGQLVTLYNLENLTVNGQGQSDSFSVQNNPNASIKSVQFNGNLGLDFLTGPAVGSAWKITGSNSGTLNNIIKFAGIENLTGGAGDDTFTISAGKNITGKIDGGGGKDVLDDSLFTIPVTVNLQTGAVTSTGGIQNIEVVLAGKSASDKLIGPDTTSAWNITGKNAGDVAGVFFQNIENLGGGSGNDTFTFADTASIIGKLDGGLGSGDTLDYSAYSTAISVNLQSLKATAITGGFVNIEGATGGSAGNTLTAANKTNTWTIASTNGGTLFDGSKTFPFAAFANLIGGASSDTFNTTASWTGTLNGGLGTDTLIEGGSGSHTWNITALNAGTLDGLPFTGIENLKGGSGADTFALKAGMSLTGKIDGGGGSDTLDYSAFTTPVTINLALGKATNLGGVLNLGQFVAGSSANNYFTAQNLTNAWNITTTNAGTLTNIAGTITFSGFQNLTGGSLNDNFTMQNAASAWSGYLQGGVGTDTLTAFSLTDVWTSTSLNGHKFGSIEVKQ